MPQSRIVRVCPSGFRHAVEIKHRHHIFHSSEFRCCSQPPLDAAGERAVGCRGVAVAERIVVVQKRVANSGGTWLGHSSDIVRSGDLSGHRRLAGVEKRGGRVGFPGGAHAGTRLGYIHRAGVITIGDRSRKRRGRSVLTGGPGKNRSRLPDPVRPEALGQLGVDISQDRNSSLSAVAEDIHRTAKTVINHLVVPYRTCWILKEKQNIVCCVGFVDYRCRCVFYDDICND